MDFQIKGKRALVTGSTSGIGEAIAKALAGEGVTVAVQGRNEKEAARVASEIRAAGGTAVVALGDLGTDAGADQVTAIVVRELGGVDILVNNAGQFPAKTWWEASSADWNSLYDANVTSMVRLVQRLVPSMKARQWGRVINIASVAGTEAVPALPAYSATKAANINITNSLAKELTGTGVTVNTVSPGPILTPGAEALFRNIASERGWGTEWTSIEPKLATEVFPTLTRTIGRAEDVGALVTFLASPRAGFITAANLVVDGGASH